MREKNRRYIRVVILLLIIISFFIYEEYEKKMRNNYLESYKNDEIIGIEYYKNDTKYDIDDHAVKSNLIVALKNIKGIKGKGAGESDIMIRINFLSNSDIYYFTIFKDNDINEYFISTGRYMTFFAFDSNNYIDKFYNTYIGSDS